MYKFVEPAARSKKTEGGTMITAKQVLSETAKLSPDENNKIRDEAASLYRQASDSAKESIKNVEVEKGRVSSTEK